MAENVLSHWTLYRDRDALSYHYFKTRTPKEKIRREFVKWQETQTGKKAPVDSLYVPYDRMSDEGKRRIDEGFRELYVWRKPFNQKRSFGLFMMERTLDLLQAHVKKAVFYTAPLDYDLIANRKLFDWDDYGKVMGEYRKLVESRGFQFVEFNEGKNVVPHKYYRDPTHLTDEGSRKFGEILYDRIRDSVLE